MAHILNNPSYGEGHQVILKENLSNRIVTDFKKYDYIAGKTIFTMTKKNVSPKITYSLSDSKLFINFIDDKKRIIKMYGSDSSFNSTFNHVGSKGGKSDTNKLTEVKELISICVFEQFLKYNKKVDFDFVDKFLPANLRNYNHKEYVDSAHLQLDTWLKNEKGKFRGNYNYERQMGKFTKDMYDNVKKITGLQKDNWNPGDIWLIKNGFKMDKYEKSNNINEINKMLIEDYNKQNLVGISLKQILPKHSPSYKKINLDNKKKQETEYDFTFDYCDLSDTFNNAIVYTKSGFAIRIGYKASSTNYNVYLEGRFKSAGVQTGAVDAKKFPDEVLKRYNYNIRKIGEPDHLKESVIALREYKKMFALHGADKMANKINSVKQLEELYNKSEIFVKKRFCKLSSFMYPFLVSAFEKKDFKNFMEWNYHTSKKETSIGGFYIYLGP